MQEAQERHVYEWFWWSVVLKGLISIGEMIAGIAVYLVPPALITAIASQLLQSEIAENPFIATNIVSLAQGFTTTVQLFIAIYLFTRGFIKLLLILALLKNKLWAYPASLVVLGLFVLYQIYDIVKTHSIIVTAITVFDLIVMYFIWREWQVVRKHPGLHLPKGAPPLPLTD